MADKITDRVKKLLRLARNAGSEAEAAIAAQRASELMAMHEIHEAQLRLDEPDEAHAPEAIDPRFALTKTKRRVAWQSSIASGVAATYRCRMYWVGGSIKLFGRLSAVQAASYTCQYLFREVERLADAECAGRDRSYRNGFRLGAADKIQAKLYAAVRARKQSPRPVSAESPFDAPAACPGPQDDAQDDAPAEVAPTNEHALAVVERDHEEVQQTYDKYSSKWSGGGASLGRSSGGGYGAGSDAADRIALGGGSRGALRAGRGVLT